MWPKSDQLTIEEGPSSFEDEASFSESGDDLFGLDPTTAGESTSGEGESAEESESMTIGKRETRTVWGVKILFVFVLFLSAAGALGVHFYIRGRENSEFEAQFYDDSTKVFAAVAATLEFTLSASDAFSASIISSAQTAQQEWPFVTVPNWPARAGKVRSLTGALFVNLYMWVEGYQRDEWETYTSYNNDWVMETVEAQLSDPSYEGNTTVHPYYENWDVIHGYDEYYKENAGVNGTNMTGPHLVWWQCVPVLAVDPVYNWDLMTEGIQLTDCSTNSTAESDDCHELSNYYDVLVKRHQVVVDAAYMILPENATEAQIEAQQYEGDWMANYLPPDEDPEEPVTDIYYPILPTAIDSYNQNDPDSFDPMDHEVKGILSTTFYWRDMIRDILPLGSDGILVVFENPCNPTFTYEINGPTVRFLGPGDHHDPNFNHLEARSNLLDLTDYTIKGSSYTGVPVARDYKCMWKLRIYPSQTMKDNYTSESATIFTVTAAIVFLITSIVFCIYDRTVERRQRVVLSTAEKTHAVVASLFPSSVRDRLYESDQNVSKYLLPNKGPNMEVVGTEGSPPVAETFAEVTVCFIDIKGFTAWSSARDPHQVFVLLETLYQMFDSVASRRRVFKVETIGDSYLCCTGLPHPQKHHASIMVRFCAEVRNRKNVMGPELDLKLGPGTSDLKLRIGLHSGPCTAGVLRGQKARFQLFGDTVNTAARLESTGMPGRIHISAKTAEQLSRENKGHWVTEREEQQTLKGKGKLKTYFAEPQRGANTMQSCASDVLIVPPPPEVDEEQKQEVLQERLIDWMAVMMEELLKEVVKHRMSRKVVKKPELQSIRSSVKPGSMVRDEVLDSIPLPTYEAKNESRRSSTRNSKAVEDVDLGAGVLRQLRNYIAVIASGYNPNSFHNFEHACHVAMSSRKLLQRVITAGEEAAKMEFADEDVLDHTEGIRSDPLTQFAITFSALVHDLDHPGVANGQLVKEQSPLAARYQNLSVAEQNSVDLALNLLMEDRFSDLQVCICPDTDEYKRFRQVVVNAVVTTDIFDKELKAAREQRWGRTYGAEARLEQEIKTAVIERKATIVIELVIQASDVSHTMQHWHIYQKWNHRLLLEQYAAFKAGRQEKNPLDGWAGGELWFFDNYIIPLATKMRDCKVFGVSCDEFLDYATDNRLEWASKGKDIVAEWAETIEEDYKEVLSNPSITIEDITESSFSGDPVSDLVTENDIWV